MPYDMWTDDPSGGVRFGDSATGDSVLLPKNGPALLEMARIDSSRRASDLGAAAGGDPFPARDAVTAGSVERAYMGPEQGPGGKVLGAELNAQPNPDGFMRGPDGELVRILGSGGPNMSSPEPMMTSAVPADAGAGGSSGGQPPPPQADVTGAGGPGQANEPPPATGRPNPGPAEGPTREAAGPSADGLPPWKPGGGAPPAPGYGDRAADLYDKASKDALRPTGGGVIKGGKFQTGEQRQMDGMLDPDTLGNMSVNRRLQAQAAGNLQEEEARIAGDVEARRDIQRESYDNAIRNAEAKGEEEAGANRDAYRAKLREVEEGKIDPDKWWSSRSTGQKASAVASGVLAGLADAFSARAAAYGGGPKTNRVGDFIKIMQDEVEQDLRAQHANLDKKKGELGELGKIYQDTLARTKDRVVALNVAKAAAIERVAAVAVAKANESGSPLAERRAEKFAADAQVASDALYAENASRLKVAQTFVVKQDQRFGGGRPNYEKAAQLLEKAQKASGGDGKEPVVSFGGESLTFRPNVPEAIQSDTIKTMQAVNGIHNNMDELVTQQQKLGANVIDRKTAEAMVTTVAAQVNGALGQGAMSKDEKEGWVGSLTGMNAADAQKFMHRGLDNVAKGKIEVVMKPAGRR